MAHILHVLSPTFGGVGFNLHPYGTHSFCCVQELKWRRQLESSRAWVFTYMLLFTTADYFYWIRNKFSQLCLTSALLLPFIKLINLPTNKNNLGINKLFILYELPIWDLWKLSNQFLLTCRGSWDRWSENSKYSSRYRNKTYSRPHRHISFNIFKQ